MTEDQNTYWDEEDYLEKRAVEVTAVVCIPHEDNSWEEVEHYLVKEIQVALRFVALAGDQVELQTEEQVVERVAEQVAEQSVGLDGELDGELDEELDEELELVRLKMEHMRHLVEEKLEYWQEEIYLSRYNSIHTSQQH